MRQTARTRLSIIKGPLEKSFREIRSAAAVPHGIALSAVLAMTFAATLAATPASTVPLPADAAASPARENETPEPVLFFNAADIPALKTRVLRSGYKNPWDDLLAEARDYCDPASPRYASPGTYLAKAAEGSSGANAHYFGRDLTVRMQTLGLAWIITRDETFARHGIALLETGASDAITAILKDNRFAGTKGDMMRALATGLDLFSGALTPARRAPVARAARQYAIAQTRAYNQPGSEWKGVSVWHNFNGVCGGALGMLAIALRTDFPDESAAWLQVAEEMTLTWLSKGIDADGAGLEGVLYLNYGIGNPVLFADALWRLTGSRRAIIDHPHLKLATRFLVMQLLPGETNVFDARNDSLYNTDLNGYKGVGVAFLLSLASGFHGATAPDPLAHWLWHKTKARSQTMMRIALPPFDPAQSAAFDAPPPADPSATIPTPIGQHFRQRGLCVWRTGWQRHDVMFSIEAGPYHHVTHNQADKGHFTLYGLGYRWAADVGYGNDRNPDGRCQTTAHSCVLIDGRGQALSGAALGTSGKILRYENTHKSGYALADAKPAYDANNAGQPGVPVRRALRHAFLVRPSGGIPAYAVVLDDIQARAPDADGKNNYTWQMITWADMRVEQPPGHPSTFILTPPGPAGAVPRMVVALAASAPLALGSAPFHPDDTPGRPPYDYRRLRAETRAANPHFAALLAPLPPGAPAPRFTAEGIAGAGDSARIQISITWPDRTDIIEWRDDSATLKPAPGYYP